MRPLRIAAACLALLCGGASASAHPGSLAFWKVTIDETRARSQILVSLLDFGWTAEDLDDGGEAFRTRRLAIASRLLDHFVVVQSGSRTPARVIDTRVVPGGSLEIVAEHTLAGGARVLALRSSFHELTDDSHRVIARVEHLGDVEPLVLSAFEPEHVVPDVVPASRYHAIAPAGSLRAMLLLGIEHILTGYDHLVFLLCLLIPGGTWRSRVAIVTAFTAAHSLTLMLAAAEVVTPPARFVEAAIALSIGYVAIENLLYEGPRTRWPTAFGFGLIHGFGFAGMLQELDMPLGRWLSSVAAFNVGVEIGQLAVVAIAVPVVASIARYSWYRRFVQSTSIVVCLLAVFWLVERLA